MGKNAKSKNLLSLAFIFLVIGVFLSCANNSPKDFYYSGNYPPIKTITINENGQDYYLKAVSGHVIVIFKPTISYLQAVQFIKKMKGMIIGQTVDIGYYLVYVGSGNESGFINRIKNNPDISFTGLNAVEYPCAVVPQTSVIDNFYISHGNNVTYVLQECGLKTNINEYNVGIKGDESGRMVWSEIDFDLHSALKNAPDNTPLIINMSFGPGFTDPDIYFWTDKNITDDVKNNYKKHYKEGLKNLASLVANYQEIDFVIVKAAGNEGLKDIDIEILNELGAELSDTEFNILNDHFILVGAEDNRDQKYSNTVSKGNYNFLYTAVDISDLKYKNENLYGTSFAAPRVSCFISSLVNEHSIKATDVLKVIKNITYRNPDQVLTQKDLEREAKILSANKPIESKTNSNISSQAENSYIRNEQKNVVGNQVSANELKGDNRNALSQTWEEGDYWKTYTYTVINKAQFDAMIKDSIKKFAYIAIDYTSNYIGSLPGNNLNIKKPYYLMNTWEGTSVIYDYNDLLLPQYKVSFYYIGIEGGVHIKFADSISFWAPYTWFRTNSWPKKYLELLIEKSNGTNKNIDRKINGLYTDLHKKGQIVN